MVERNHVAMRKERMQDEGHRFGVPGVPIKAQKRRRALGRRSLRRGSHPCESCILGRADLKTLRRRGKADPGRSRERGRKEKPSLGEIHARDDDDVESHQSQNEVDDPHGLDRRARRAPLHDVIRPRRVSNL